MDARTRPTSEREALDAIDAQLLRAKRMTIFPRTPLAEAVDGAEAFIRRSRAKLAQEAEAAQPQRWRLTRLLLRCLGRS